jgi:HlyD family secretion protein
MSLPPSTFLPAALAEHSVESLGALHGPDRPWIYWLSLLAVGAALGALPLIPVEITVRSSGIVRPVTERTELKAGISGRIAAVLARDNVHVAANQPLLELSVGDAEERLARNRVLQREKSGLVADLRALTAAPVPPRPEKIPTAEPPAALPDLKTPVLIREHARFLAQYEVDRLALAKARVTQGRTATLAAKGIVTEGERDDAYYTTDRAAADLQLLVQQTLSGWQSQLHDEQTALDQLVSEEKRLQEELALSVVRAPAAGTVQGLTGLSAGAFVVAGQSFGYVSPDAPLQVETYVSPKDIGCVRIGQAVRLQIDAYPYTEWGLLEGRIEEVAADAINNGQQPMFKVLVRPAVRSLRLRNGTTGALRKGMTLTARFVVGRRSLFQVLCEDASEWLAPQDRPTPS